MSRPVARYSRIIKPIRRYIQDRDSIVVYHEASFNFEEALRHLYIGVKNISDDVFTPGKFSELLVNRGDGFFIITFPKYFVKKGVKIELKIYYFTSEESTNRIIARIMSKK